MAVLKLLPAKRYELFVSASTVYPNEMKYAPDQTSDILEAAL